MCRLDWVDNTVQHTGKNPTQQDAVGDGAARKTQTHTLALLLSFSLFSHTNSGTTVPGNTLETHPTYHKHMRTECTRTHTITRSGYSSVQALLIIPSQNWLWKLAQGMTHHSTTHQRSPFPYTNAHPFHTPTLTLSIPAMVRPAHCASSADTAVSWGTLINW
jgi:hypothetical protein